MFPTTTSQVLGFVKAVHVGATAPENVYMLWVDTSVKPFVHKYFNSQTETWTALNVNNLENIGNVKLSNTVLFVAKTGDDNTAQVGNLAKPYLSISAAYVKAKQLNPSKTNRVAIVVYPGDYEENITIDVNYVDLLPAIEQPAIFSKALVALATLNSPSYVYTHTGRSISIGTVNVNASNTVVKGINTRELNIRCLGDTYNVFENIFAESINQNDGGLTNQTLHGNFIDVHAINFFTGGYFTLKANFTKCGGLTGFLKDDGGQITESDFDECYCGNDSFGQAGVNILHSRFNRLMTGTNCFAAVEDCEFIACKFGDSNITKSTGSTFTSCKFRKNSVKDFLASTFKDSSAEEGFGKGGVLTLLTGTFDNFKGNFAAKGFCEGRPFRGKLRLLDINCQIDTVALFINSAQNDIAVIEYCRIKNCGAGGTVEGNYAEICFSRFNKDYAVINTLGTNSVAQNVVSVNICTYVPDNTGITACPVVNNIQAVNNNGTLSVTFAVPVAGNDNPVVQYKVSYYDPANPAVVMFGYTNTNTKNFVVTPGVAYKVTVLTECQLTGSAAQPYVDATVSTAQRTGWRAQESSAFCQQGKATYSIQNYDAATGTHIATRTFDDGNGDVTWNYSIKDTATNTSVAYSVVFAANQLSVNVNGNGAGVFNTLTLQTWVNQVVGNTGYRGWATLEQYYIGGLNAGQPTGLTKSNVNTDLDYVAPVYNPDVCPLPVNNNTGNVTVYAKMNKKNVLQTSIIEYCDNIGGQKVTGRRTAADLYVFFFSDAACTVPLDITGHNVNSVKIQVESEDPTYEMDIDIVGAGTSVLVGSDMILTYEYWGCNDVVMGAQVTNYTLLDNGQYIAG